jgi:hypothetical protein
MEENICSVVSCSSLSLVAAAAAVEGDAAAAVIGSHNRFPLLSPSLSLLLGQHQPLRPQGGVLCRTLRVARARVLIIHLQFDLFNNDTPILSYSPSELRLRFYYY